MSSIVYATDNIFFLFLNFNVFFCISFIFLALVLLFSGLNYFFLTSKQILFAETKPTTSKSEDDSAENENSKHKKDPLPFVNVDDKGSPTSPDKPKPDTFPLVTLDDKGSPFSGDGSTPQKGPWYTQWKLIALAGFIVLVSVGGIWIVKEYGPALIIEIKNWLEPDVSKKIAATAKLPGPPSKESLAEVYKLAYKWTEVAEMAKQYKLDKELSEVVVEESVKIAQDLMAKGYTLDKELSHVVLQQGVKIAQALIEAEARDKAMPRS